MKGKKQDFLVPVEISITKVTNGKYNESDEKSA